MAVRDDRLGTPMDVQACQHDSTAHLQRFFFPEGESR